MGRLTTHVLDTAQGKPGAGNQNRALPAVGRAGFAASAVTNQDGRCPQPLLEGRSLRRRAI